METNQSSSPQPTRSPWNDKPWWCQPWSVLLTGISAIAGSWWLAKMIWLTIIVAIPILTWMGFFLLIWPKLMMDYPDHS